MGYIRLVVAEELRQQFEADYGVEQWLGAAQRGQWALIKVPGGIGSDTKEAAPQAIAYFRTDQLTGKIVFDKIKASA